MTFAAGGTIPVFAGMAAPTDFAAGNQLEWIGPGVPDATLADIAWTVYAEDHL
jgi:hypothetical protein